MGQSFVFLFFKICLFVQRRKVGLKGLRMRPTKSKRREKERKEEEEEVVEEEEEGTVGLQPSLVVRYGLSLPPFVISFSSYTLPFYFNYSFALFSFLSFFHNLKYYLSLHTIFSLILIILDH